MPARTHLRLLGVLPLAFAILASASTLAPAPQASASSSTASSRASARAHARVVRTHKVHRAAVVALRQLGDPYRYGAQGPHSFDCSGLMRYSYKKAGLRLPRTASAQSHRAHRIPKKNLRRGDLMFFTDGGGVYHAAMFLKWKKGHAVMVEAPGRGGHVRRARPWTTHWFAGTLR